MLKAIVKKNTYTHKYELLQILRNQYLSILHYCNDDILRALL